MKHVMRYLTFFLILGTGPTLFGQMNILAGLGISYGSEASAIGINFKGDVDLTETWGGSMNIITYISPDFGQADLSGVDGIKAKYWEINFDAHYFVINEESYKVYPLAGLNLSTAGVKLDVNIPGFGGFGGFGETETKVGLNLGGGARFAVAESIWLFGELKYVLSDFDQLVISAGGLYHF